MYKNPFVESPSTEFRQSSPSYCAACPFDSVQIVSRNSSPSLFSPIVSAFCAACPFDLVQSVSRDCSSSMAPSRRSSTCFRLNRRKGLRVVPLPSVFFEETLDFRVTTEGLVWYNVAVEATETPSSNVLTPTSPVASYSFAVGFKEHKTGNHPRPKHLGPRP